MTIDLGFFQKEINSTATLVGVPHIPVAQKELILEDGAQMNDICSVVGR